MQTTSLRRRLFTATANSFPRPSSRVLHRLKAHAATLAALSLLLASAVCGAAAVSVTDLRCEYLQDPLGIDVARPRLSWVLSANGRGARQSAYQVIVAATEARLKAGVGDLWDSDRLASDQSIHVRYQGKPLASQMQCFWKVRVWDQDGKASAWSEPARWSMGLLNPADWKAKWIGRDESETKNLISGTQWIWFPEGNPVKDAPVATRYFRRSVTLPQNRPIKQARFLVTADNEFVLFVNGKQAGAGNNFKAVADIDLAPLLRPGDNILAVAAKNVGAGANPAGLLGRLRIEFAQGEPLVIATDQQWKASVKDTAGWKEARFDDSGWKAAQVLGPVGMSPWGDLSGPEDRRLPARYLRREFAVEKKVRRATAYVSGLGLFELYLNDQKVGDHVLSPGLTEYPKRVFYVTFDVTKQLKAGANALGVILGNGRYYAPRSSVPTATRTYGFPKLLLQLRVDYDDGSVAEIVSDETWKLTTNGPIRANNEYDGEEYDARLEMDGWARPGFDDSAWEKVQPVSAPGGALVAQMIAPIRVTESLKPIAIANPKPGVFIFDMGQNMVGWCRLKVAGAPGTAITLRHAEILRPDGTLYLDNIRSAKVTDVFTLKGKGTEVYEPRFTYHGFRYVEMKGFPGTPKLSALEGCVVNDDVRSAGEFASSNPLLNRIYRNVCWGVRGNYRSISTDCPQRDERQGWLGDRSAESRGETYLFNIAALYSKWLQDMADAQKDSGSVPDVCPSYWPLYSDNVTWPSSTVIIPSALQEQYGDTAIIEQHYPSMKKWIDFMCGFLKNDLMPRDTYGDWCVPPEEQKLIHSKDPMRKTSPTILGTTYFYYDLRLMARYATLLGKSDDARRYTELAEKLKTAFNLKYLKTGPGYYDNGSQTSCVLPLAFDMVPAGERARIFNHLVAKITNETKGHVGTGLIGGQWLMRTLSDNGRPDLAYTIATRNTYPSWGYMIEKGATTIWELWNGDTADPAMNSGNHVMLVGDLIIWCYEYLAGIKPDPEQPGFKHILMRPAPVGDLQAVQATHRSPYGLIASDWKLDGGRFIWNVTVPANTTATVCVPTTDAERVRESGKPARQAAGVQFLRAEDGRAVFEVGAGSYRFTAPLGG